MCFTAHAAKQCDAMQREYSSGRTVYARRAAGSPSRRSGNFYKGTAFASGFNLR
jgi:hypothetical protein